MKKTLTHLQINWTKATHQDAVSAEIMALLQEVHS